MGDGTKIEWATLGLDRAASWNPIRARRWSTGDVGFHCEHVSEACRNCYAEALNKRLFGGLDYKPGNRGKVEIFLDEKTLLAPLRWKAPRGIFVCSMTDIFADFVTDDMRDCIFAVMVLAPQHRKAVLTKRSARMRAYCSDPATPKRIAAVILQMSLDGHVTGAQALVPLANRARERDPEIVAWPPPNVWAGTTVEDQATADERIPHLLATPAAVRWVSVEPMLGAVQLDDIVWRRTGNVEDHISALYCEDSPEDVGDEPFWINTLNWVVCGGESGPGARPMSPDWARGLRDQCKAAGVAFFFKQWGEWRPVSPHIQPSSMAFGVGPKDLHSAFGPVKDGWIQGESLQRVGKKRAGRLLDGVTHDEFPEARNV